MEYIPAIRKKHGQFVSPDGWERNWSTSFTDKEAAEEYAEKWAKQESIEEWTVFTSEEA